MGGFTPPWPDSQAGFPDSGPTPCQDQFSRRCHPRSSAATIVASGCRNLTMRGWLAGLMFLSLTLNCGSIAAPNLAPPPSPDAERLPQRYEGMDLAAIAREMYRRHHQLQKNEFETQAEFEARRSAAQRANIAPTVPLSGIFAFIVNWPARYEADSEIFSIPTLLTPWLTLQENRTAREMNLGNYTQYPVILIEEFNLSSREIGVCNRELFPIRIQMSRERARELAPLNVLVLGTLSPIEPVSFQENITAPDYRRRFTSWFKSYSLNVEARQIVVFGRESGEIVHRASLGCSG